MRFLNNNRCLRIGKSTIKHRTTFVISVLVKSGALKLAYLLFTKGGMLVQDCTFQVTATCPYRDVDGCRSLIRAEHGPDTVFTAYAHLA